MSKSTLTKSLTLAAVCLSMSTLAFTPPLQEVDGRSVPQIGWDTTLEKFQFDQDKFAGQRFTAMCLPSSKKMKGDGDKDAAYPSDHSICSAALQAGIIDEKGGLVTVQLNPSGSVEGGTGGRTISVVSPSGSDATNQIYREHIQQIQWDTKFTSTGVAYKHLIGQQFSFKCPHAPSNLSPRRVVGTDLYAFKSLVCLAGVHAGKITKEGGIVTVQMNPASKKLTGSTRNGIETKKGSSGLSALSFVDNPVMP